MCGVLCDSRLTQKNPCSFYCSRRMRGTPLTLLLVSLMAASPGVTATSLVHYFAKVLGGGGGGLGAEVALGGQCTMAQWGAWARCSSACGEGRATRQRVVLARSTLHRHDTPCPAVRQARSCRDGAGQCVCACAGSGCASTSCLGCYYIPECAAKKTAICDESCTFTSVSLRARLSSMSGARSSSVLTRCRVTSGGVGRRRGGSRSTGLMFSGVRAAPSARFEDEALRSCVKGTGFLGFRALAQRILYPMTGS